MLCGNNLLLFIDTVIEDGGELYIFKKKDEEMTIPLSYVLLVYTHSQVQPFHKRELSSTSPRSKNIIHTSLSKSECC